MTREQNIEKIRVAAIKANPEIMELKFGCVASAPFRGKYYWHQVVNTERDRRWGSDGAEYVYVVREAFNTTKKVPRAEIRTVRGRPIRLADVLLAVGWGNLNASNALRDLLHKWNLRADDLTAQSDETLLFLSDLLK